MATQDEIRKLQSEGKSDQEIIQTLSSRGIPESEISDALGESKIKAAVNAPEPGNEEMIPSIMTEVSQGDAPAPGEPVSMAAQDQYAPGQYQEQYPPQYAESYPPQYSPEGYPQQYPVYQPSGLSPDTITEIAEQVIAEKLEDTKTKLQQVASFKASIEASIENIDSRLERIEKVIDRLQLSVLQKVGDYVNNVDDIKRELVETQKSFKSLLPQLRTAQPEQKPTSRKSKSA